MAILNVKLQGSIGVTFNHVVWSHFVIMLTGTGGSIIHVILIFSSADGNYHLTTMTKATLFHHGLVKWEPPAIFKSSCDIDVRCKQRKWITLFYFAKKTIFDLAIGLDLQNKYKKYATFLFVKGNLKFLPFFKMSQK